MLNFAASAWNEYNFSLPSCCFTTCSSVSFVLVRYASTQIVVVLKASSGWTRPRPPEALRRSNLLLGDACSAWPAIFLPRVYIQLISFSFQLRMLKIYVTTNVAKVWQ